MFDLPTRQKVAAAVESKGANAVAGALGVPRGTVLSYIAGRSREGTDLLIESRASRLDGLARPSSPPPPQAKAG